MLLQYLIVFAVVIIAAIVVTRKLLYQSKGRGCQGCNCPGKSEEFRKLIKSKEH
ncbi:MAG: FeoB-associated Cys-rich membrane protein [candidate division Zixibacteria bacterium]|nr:FeoB-associated Cys-rich membrane protein [candidate division Zixibacteria bacterium]